MTDDVQPPCDTEPSDLRMQGRKAESDESLDCRNVNPIFHIKPAAPLTPAQAGIARALRRLCDGAERRMGCADYEPER
jgi:hypothetical protein